MLSEEAVHDKLICDDDTAVAERLVGVEGGVLSGTVTVTVVWAVTDPCGFVAVRV
jgi:hypothetical protein